MNQSNITKKERKKERREEKRRDEVFMEVKFSFFHF
jgi:hypothetical protein